MEGPQLRNFQDYQALWAGVWDDIFNFVMDANDFGGNRDLDVDFPAVLVEPIGEFTTSLQTSQEAGYVPFDEAARLMLVRLGSNDIDRLLEQAKTEKEERDRKQEELQRQGQMGQPTNGRPASPQGQRAGDNRPQTSAPPTQEFDFEEHGDPVDGSCPLCDEDGTLIEDHGIRFCTYCRRSYNPDVLTSRVDFVSDQATIFAEAMIEAGRRGNPEALRKYWRKRIGKDLSKGQFTDCHSTLIRSERAAAICAGFHKQATGLYPAQKYAKMGWKRKKRPKKRVPS